MSERGGGAADVALAVRSLPIEVLMGGGVSAIGSSGPTTPVAVGVTSVVAGSDVVAGGRSTVTGDVKGLPTAPAANAALNEPPVAIHRIPTVLRVSALRRLSVGAACRGASRVCAERGEDARSLRQFAVVGWSACGCEDVAQVREGGGAVEVGQLTGQESFGIVGREVVGTFAHDVTGAPESLKWAASRRSARCWVTRTQPGDRCMIAAT